MNEVGILFKHHDILIEFSRVQNDCALTKTNNLNKF